MLSFVLGLLCISMFPWLLYCNYYFVSLIGIKKSQHNSLNELKEVKVNQKIIVRAAKTKFLCLSIDENLSWEDQYKEVKVNVKSSLSALQRLKDILPESKLAAVYWALTENHLRYGNMIWGCISDAKLDNMQKLQSGAEKLIESRKHKEGWVCDWLSVKKLIKYDRLVMAHKVLNGKCPENVSTASSSSTASPLHIYCF